MKSAIASTSPNMSMRSRGENERAWLQTSKFIFFCQLLIPATPFEFQHKQDAFVFRLKGRKEPLEPLEHSKVEWRLDGDAAALVPCKEEGNVFMQIVLQLLLWTCFIIKFQPLSPAHTQAAACIFSLYERLPQYVFAVWTCTLRLTGDFQLRPGVTNWFICLQLFVSAGAASLIKLQWTKNR